MLLQLMRAIVYCTFGCTLLLSVFRSVWYQGRGRWWPLASVRLLFQSFLHLVLLLYLEHLRVFDNRRGYAPGCTSNGGAVDLLMKLFLQQSKAKTKAKLHFSTVIFPALFRTVIFHALTQVFCCKKKHLFGTFSSADIGSPISLFSNWKNATVPSEEQTNISKPDELLEIKRHH